MAGETDLAVMLAGLRISRRPGTYVVVTVGPAPEDEVADTAGPGGPNGPANHTPAGSLGLKLGGGIEALIAEAEGITVIATVARARAEGWAFDFVAAWLTLEVHSALEAVGLTAAVSAALTAEGIACNVVAGYHHDHILVPAERAADAVACLEALRTDVAG